ncbi:MAG: chloride channel protein [Planctomycetota bacterium]
MPDGEPPSNQRHDHEPPESAADRVVDRVGIVGARFRVLLGRIGKRLGLAEETLILPMAVLVGVVTAAAAVGFHELILILRDTLYARAGEDFLYGPGIWMLLVIPAVGGLVVGIISRVVSGEKEGHGVVDVIESVKRTRGFVRPRTAVEKIVTSAVSIGSGGSAGAEGPIVQIGAAVSSGVARFFRLPRHQMPVLVACGCAAGISAIFNAPIGGLLFTLEVVLHDFRARAITPVVVSAVIANVTMRALVNWLYVHGHSDAAYITIFDNPQIAFTGGLLNWPQVPAYVTLGLACGIGGAILIRMMQAGDVVFRKLVTGPSWVKAFRPAVGGLCLGACGVAAVLIAGGEPGPFAFEDYPMPAFYGDGYGIIETLLGSVDGSFYDGQAISPLVGLLLGLAVVKMLATVFTLSSGGSGGVIAPSLFVGAVIGGAVGVVARQAGVFGDVSPEAYTLVGMAAFLAAVVHAPLASILILLEITGESAQNQAILLPALLTVVVAMGSSRLVHRDSIYTAALRRRGVRTAAADPAVLSRLTIEQVGLDPTSSIQVDEPFEKVVELVERWQVRDFAVLDAEGRYVGFLPESVVGAALEDREAVPLVVAGELMRRDVPLVSSDQDLLSTFDQFVQLDVARLPVGLDAGDGRVIGMITRSGVMRRYQHAIEE